MTVPFENDTGNIVRKLARKSLKSEKRRNLMVVIAVALASCLICFSIVMALSTRQIEKNHVEDTYEAVYTRITEEDVSTLKGLDDFSRVGEYYMLAVEPAEQGYNASYIYCDEETMYIARDQMKLLEGRLPQKEDEVVVSRYFLSNYGADAGIGEKVMLSSESFHGEYTVTGIMEGYKEKEVNGSSILLSKEALKGWSGYDPADYRAYVHFKNEQQMDETELTARSREIAKEYQLEMPIMNLSYMKFYKQPVNVSMLALVAGIAVLVIIGGYVVIQSIFRISINDKIQSYGQLRTIGTTPKQIRSIVKKEGRFLGWAGIGIGILLGCAAGFALFSRGFHLPFYAAAVVLTALLGRFMVSIAIRRPVKIAAGISPIEAVLDEPELPDTGKQHLPSQAQPGQPEVQFSDVAFAYQDKEVLHHINFAMKKNSMTALVGPSGGGKSTIANLLARLWDVKSGSVTIRGVDTRNVPLSELMDQISMVFQRVYLFQDTIYNNISMGKPDATEEEVYEAAKKARCYDFIMALPDGFQTVVGEGGATLSGGEKQRISIARCILKDAPIVILDEATASVDTDNESYIQEAISELVKGKTLLVIAHRLNTIQNADQILVIDNGQIAQHGTHEELLEQPGIYQDFVNIRKSAAGWSLV